MTLNICLRGLFHTCVLRIHMRIRMRIRIRQKSRKLKYHYPDSIVAYPYLRIRMRKSRPTKIAQWAIFVGYALDTDGIPGSRWRANCQVKNFIMGIRGKVLFLNRFLWNFYCKCRKKRSEILAKFGKDQINSMYNYPLIWCDRPFSKA